jgi:P-type Cu+ transporter
VAGEATGGTREVRLIVPGMGSDHCSGIVSESIRRLPGIADVSTNVASHRVRVRFDGAQTDAEAIRTAIERAGYEVDAVETATAPSARETEASEDRYLAQAWSRLLFAAVPAH